MQSTHVYIKHMFFAQSDVLFSDDETSYLVEYVKGDVMTSFKVHRPRKLTPSGALKKQVVMNIDTNKLILSIEEDSWQSSSSTASCENPNMKQWTEGLPKTTCPSSFIHKAMKEWIY